MSRVRYCRIVSVAKDGKRALAICHIDARAVQDPFTPKPLAGYGAPTSVNRAAAFPAA
jgi:hypothetical protein